MSKINIKPLADRVLVQPSEAETTTSSGIIIPDTAKEKPQRGKIVAAGPGTKDNPVTLKAGDIVLVHDTGAYTATYSSVGFNGLSPLRVCLVEDINQMKFPKLQAI